jgi:hypothetical protein
MDGHQYSYNLELGMLIQKGRKDFLYNFFMAKGARKHLFDGNSSN